MKKLLLLVLIILVAAGLYKVGVRYGAFGTATEQVSDQTESTITAPFRCDDDSSFVAEFPASMESVTIASEGETNAFPNVASTSGKKYEDAGWTFVFRGETATVTDRTLKTTKTCNPPFDPDNAPVNFGD